MKNFWLNTRLDETVTTQSRERAALLAALAHRSRRIGLSAMPNGPMKDILAARKSKPPRRPLRDALARQVAWQKRIVSGAMDRA